MIINWHSKLVKRIIFSLILSNIYNILLGNSIQLREVSLFEEDPLYDSVASDEDYSTVPENQEKCMNKECSQTTDKNSAISLHNVNTTNQMLKQLTSQLKNSNGTITELKAQISKLRQHIETLENENCDLKNRLSQNKSTSRINGDSGFASLGFISEVSNAIDLQKYLIFLPITCKKPLIVV